VGPPLQLTPVTADIDEATEWFEVLPAAMGIEGLVVKGASTRYTPGRRDAWVKIRSVGVAVFDELTRGTCDQVSDGSRGASL
jgi:ATP-dependent DNA ligase